jgi:hypothetical protein
MIEFKEHNKYWNRVAKILRDGGKVDLPAYAEENETQLKLFDWLLENRDISYDGQKLYLKKQ